MVLTVFTDRFAIPTPIQLMILRWLCGMRGLVWFVTMVVTLMLGAYFELHKTADALTLQSSVEQTVLQSPGIVGINMQINNGAYPIVLQVYPGTPAFKVGIQPGDQIMAVENMSTLGLSRSAVDQAISDVPGQKVRLMMLRNGQLVPKELTVMSLDQMHPNDRAMFLMAP